MVSKRHSLTCNGNDKRIPFFPLDLAKLICLSSTRNAWAWPPVFTRTFGIVFLENDVLSEVRNEGGKNNNNWKIICVLYLRWEELFWNFDDNVLHALRMSAKFNVNECHLCASSNCIGIGIEKKERIHTRSSYNREKRPTTRISRFYETHKCKGICVRMAHHFSSLAPPSLIFRALSFVFRVSLVDLKKLNLEKKNNHLASQCTHLMSG